MSLREYARAVDRSPRVVTSMVNGYAAWAEAGGGVNLPEAIERAKMSEEKAVVTEAVAKAHGITFTHARKTRADEVRLVRAAALERAEQHGTTMEDEAAKVASRPEISTPLPGRGAAGGRAAGEGGGGVAIRQPNTNPTAAREMGGTAGQFREAKTVV